MPKDYDRPYITPYYAELKEHGIHAPLFSNTHSYGRGADRETKRCENVPYDVPNSKDRWLLRND